MSASDHYFTASPQGPQQERTVQVSLAGREVSVVTAAGVFSGDRLDLGTRVLLRHTPPPPLVGDLLDLGCGWGPLALTMAMHSPAATVWAVDVNERAVALTARNAAQLGLTNVRACVPDAVPEQVRFAAIWSNPPIRVGKESLHALLLRWLPRVTDHALAHLVVQRNLGADSLQTWLENALNGSDAQTGDDQSRPDGDVGVPRFEVHRVGSAKGYRVFAVSRGSRTTDR